MKRKTQPDSLINISLRDIDPASKKFCIRFTLRDPILERSIRTVGQLVPLTVFSSKKRLLLVSGFKRCDALRHLKKKAAVAYVIAESTLKEKDLFLRALDLNRYSTISDLDKAVAIKKAKYDFNFGWERLEHDVLSFLNIPPSTKWIKRYLKLLELDKVVQQGMLENKLALKTALALSALAHKEQRFIVDKILTQFALSSSESCELCDLLIELSSLNSISPLKLLRQKQVTQLAAAKSVSAKQRGKSLLDQIRAMRFPHLSKYEKRFRNVVDDTRFGTEIQVTHPEGFEEDYYTLVLRWNSVEKLDRLLEEVRSRRSVLKKLFSEDGGRVL